jgi:S-adenosylmethionine hydrolase
MPEPKLGLGSGYNCSMSDQRSSETIHGRDSFFPTA